jgi:hypothetical protein
VNKRREEQYIKNVPSLNSSSIAIPQCSRSVSYNLYAMTLRRYVYKKKEAYSENHIQNMLLLIKHERCSANYLPRYSAA